MAAWPPARCNGQAMLLDAKGAVLWTKSMNRYADPQEVEKRWAELEALPTLVQPGSEPWWEKVKQAVGYGEDLAKLSGRIAKDAPLTTSFPGTPFGTYVVEWRYGGAKGNCSLTVDVTEAETVAAGEKPLTNSRITTSAQPGQTDYVQHELLRLGDRPGQVHLTVRSSGDGEAVTSVAIRPIAFPSDDLIRVGSLYRGTISEATRANPPATVELFFNVAEAGSPHTTRWADPWCFLNGRMLESEKGLLKGKWFGTGNFFMADSQFMEVPCWIEITMPQKKVLTQIVIAEDPTLPRVDTLAVDAYIESRESRSNLSEFEKRQLTRGFWYNVVKSRDNTNTYNVYKFDKPVYTRKLRVYVLGGHSSITEVELYGALPKEPTTKSTTQP